VSPVSLSLHLSISLWALPNAMRYALCLPAGRQALCLIYLSGNAGIISAKFWLRMQALAIRSRSLHEELKAMENPTI